MNALALATERKGADGMPRLDAFVALCAGKRVLHVGRVPEAAAE